MKRLLLAAFLIAPALAQDAPPKEKEPEAPAPAPAAAEPTVDLVHEVRLRSGTLLVGKIEPRLWKVTTRFGVLSVPIDSVKQVRFGRKAHPARYAEVLRLIGELAAANPDRRNHAQAALKGLREYSAPELRKAAKDHTDPEVRRVCQEVYDSLELDEEELLPADDRVETNLFSVEGSVTLGSFKVTVAELGAVNVQRRDMVSVRVYKAINERKFTVTGQHTSVGGWLDTKLQMDGDTRVTISAEGTIYFPRWGNQPMSPDGNPNMGNINGLWIGTLCGRVGAKGTMFKIGRNYKGAPKGKGTLQLCIVMNQRNQPSTGDFTVRIEKH